MRDITKHRATMDLSWAIGAWLDDFDFEGDGPIPPEDLAHIMATAAIAAVELIHTGQKALGDPDLGPTPGEPGPIDGKLPTPGGTL